MCNANPGCKAAGVLADQYNRRTVVRISAIRIVVLSLMIGTLAYNPYYYILFGFAVLGLAYGQAGGIVPKRFPKKVPLF